MKPIIFACALSLSVTSAAAADLITVSGDFSVVASATASYVANAYNDPTPAPIRLWVEQQDVALGVALVLDTDLANPALQYVTGGAGAGEVAFAAGGGPTVAAGTLVDVYYAYFDPVNDAGFGSVTFDSPVLGIVAHTTRLQFSDSLRVAGAPYPATPAFASRGWEDVEWGQLSADRLTLTFSAAASSPGDQFRIITASPAVVPEPASLLLLGTGLAACGLRRSRRR